MSEWKISPEEKDKLALLVEKAHGRCGGIHLWPPNAPAGEEYVGMWSVYIEPHPSNPEDLADEAHHPMLSGALDEILARVDE